MSLKAQSAMEYLMTYGWAILIIAVVLGALFSLGVFNGNNVLGTACVARSEYLCQTPVYSHTTGNIMVTVGQNTGTGWTSANFIFVQQGQATSGGVPVTMTAAGITNLGVVFGAMGAGQSASISLPVNNVATSAANCATAGLGGCPNVGAAATGAIWVQYTIPSVTGGQQYAQIASINIRAT